MRFPPAIIFAVVAAAVSQTAEAGPMRADIPFEFTGDVGFGYEVFVQADHPDFNAGGRLPQGVKLAWHAGNV